MKVIIPTKDRQATISTHRAEAFKGHEIIVLVHNRVQANLYAEARPAIARHLVVSNTSGDTFGLTRQREWACEHLVEPGEWFVFADDNIEQVTGPRVGYRDNATLPVEDDGAFYRGVYGNVLGATAWNHVVAEDAAEADRMGAHLVGFATTGNHFFRGKKWRPVGYVIGKMMLWKNTPYAWDHCISMEDFAHTGEHLLKHGSVLIDNFAYAKCGHYQPGGMGTYEHRVPQRKRDVVTLMNKYPGLFRIKERKDFEYGTDLAVRFTSLTQVAQWRAHLGAV